MALRLPEIEQAIRSFDLKRLFIEDLGWDRHTQVLKVTVDGKEHVLRALAEKRGMVAMEHQSADGHVPDLQLRRKIEQIVGKAIHEHVIVFVDGGKTTQIWQWVKRETGRPVAVREHYYHRAQQGLSLAQKLAKLAVTLDEEEQLTLPDVAVRARAAFDVDRVTKRFYDRFKKEHATFLGFIRGIAEQADREWYASLMLNRLMFVYFVQKKHFLDGDPDYLRHRLQRIQELRGKNKFLTFYRHFLLRLFHDGLGGKLHDRELVALIGNVPYLNGGLFEVHELETQYPHIDVPDEAFARIFDFFDTYHWHLDERPIRRDEEINPDVLGFIFEKYVNQKQTGAYYTKEDITEFICQNSIIPHLLSVAARDCAIAFDASAPVWKSIRNAPDRYIPELLRHGVDLPLPTHVVGSSGAAAVDILDAPAEPQFGLPSETWREHLNRRSRVAYVRQALRKPGARTPEELTSLNIDLRQVAQDVIDSAEGTELLRAMYRGLRGLSVLDPTCGSGAFLFAALNILEPLYEACLEKMESFVNEADARGHVSVERFEDFRAILADASKHPNRRYYILKSIVIGNLYGVDIMREATEICKLRLFLKLVAQVEDVRYLEPLPDIDFNIRTGNTLVGFATYDEARNAVESKLDFDDTMGRIAQKATAVESEFQRFRAQQLSPDPDVASVRGAKRDLQKHLRALRDELDRYLAIEYGVAAGRTKKGDKAFATWRAAHAPFHWFVEFFGIMTNGGFDAVVGNPPYVEYAKVRGEYGVLGYSTLPCGNLYAFVLERAQKLTSPRGRSGFIVPLSLVCTPRMGELRRLVTQRTCWISCYDMRPASLFEGVAQRLSIVLACGAPDGGHPTVYTGGYRRWTAEERPALLSLTKYLPSAVAAGSDDVIPKLASPIEVSILQKIQGPTLGALVDDGAQPIYVHRIVRYFVKALDFVPLFIDKDGHRGRSEDYKEFRFRKAERAQVAALLNSTLFYWFWRTHSDGFHCGYGDVYRMPYRAPANAKVHAQLEKLQHDLMTVMKQASERKTITTKTGTITYQEFTSKVGKPVMDRIDQTLGCHYGFTPEEIDFVLTYDAKYRGGVEDADNADDS